jgi:hypothetical protein
MIRPQNTAELETYVLDLLNNSLQGKIQLVSVPDEIVHDALSGEKLSALSEDTNAVRWQNEFCKRENISDCIEKDGFFKFRRNILTT